MNARQRRRKRRSVIRAAAVILRSPLARETGLMLCVDPWRRPPLTRPAWDNDPDREDP